MTWSPVAEVEDPGTNGAGYVIRRLPQGVATYQWRNKGVPGTTSWFDELPGGAGLDPSTYHVQTRDETGALGPAVVCDDLAAPVNVALADVTDTPDSNASDVTISWDATPGATDYRLYRTDDTGAETEAGVFPGTFGTDVGVDAPPPPPPSGRFRWSVSAVLHATTDGGAIEEIEGPRSLDSVTAPGATTEVTTSVAADGEVTVDWAPVATAKGYNIHRIDTATNSQTHLGWFGTPASSLQDTAARSAGGLTYRWTVEATARGGLKGDRISSDETTVDIEPPVFAGTLSITSLTDTGFDVSWDEASDNDAIAGYRVRIDGLVVADLPATARSHAVTGLAPSTTYAVDVEARDPSGGTDSLSTSATTLDPPRVEFSTEQRDGRWEVIDQEGDVVRWEAVNVRTDDLAANPLTQTDIGALADRFNAIRLPIHWDQLEPSDDTPDAALVTDICNILDWAQAEAHDGRPLQVILDYAHFGGPNTGSNAGWIPGWAWSSIGIGSYSRAKDVSFPIWSSAAYLDYVDYVMSEADCSGPNPGPIGQHPAVVAIEPMNEPHPEIRGSAWQDYAQAQHMVVYDTIIDRIRSHRPDVPIVLGAYYGGHLYDNEGATTNTNWLAAITTSVTNQSVPHPEGGPPLEVDLPGVHDSIIWTAHSYFTGVNDDDDCPDVTPACLLEREPAGPDYDGDGQPDPDGIGFNGARGAGRWTEAFNSKGCYGYPHSGRWTVTPGGTECPDRTPDDRRSFARIGMRANGWNHDRIAQVAGMPFFMGEWGMGQVRTDEGLDQGWRGARQQVCDRLIAFRTVRPETQGSGGVAINWSMWAFDTRVDGGFGLYDPAAPVAQRWQPHAAPLTSGFCRDTGTPN